MNKVRRNSFILLLITLLLMWYILKDNFSETIKIIFSCNFVFIILAVLVYIISFVLESIAFKIIVNQYNEDYTLKKSIGLSVMTKFFNGITPFSGGGQPLQVYALNKDKVKPVDGTLVVVQKFFVFQIAVVILTILAMIGNLFSESISAPKLLNVLSFVGIGLNILFLSFVYFLCISKSTNKKIVKFFIKILSKLRLIKNKEEKMEQWTNICNDYYEGYKRIKSNRKNFIICTILEFFATIFLFLMPYFVFKSFGVSTPNIYTSLILSTYVFIVGSFVPIPGGSGGIEYAFIGFFTLYFDKNYLLSSLVIWRFLNYYLPVLIGGIVFNLKTFKKSK